MKMLFASGISHISSNILIFLLVILTAVVPVYAQASASVLFPRANTIVTFRSQQTSLLQGYAVRTENGVDTVLDLDSDGLVDQRILSRRNLRIQFGNPRNGVFDSVSIEVHESDTLKRAVFLLEPNKKRLDLWSYEEKPAPVFYSSLSEEQQKLICSFKERGVGYWTTLASEVSAAALSNDPWFNGLIDKSCDSHRDLVVKAYAQLMVSEGRRDRKLLACADEGEKLVHHAVKAKTELIGLLHNNIERVVVSCPKSLPDGRQIRLSDKGIELAPNLLVAGKEDDLVNGLFHEALHLAGIKDEEVIKLHEKCCSLGQTPGTTCEILNKRAFKQYAEHGLESLLARLANENPDGIKGTEDRLNGFIANLKLGLTCRSQQNAGDECGNKISKEIEKFHTLVIEEVCEKNEKLRSLCKELKETLASRLADEVKNCRSTGGARSSSCLFDETFKIAEHLTGSGSDARNLAAGRQAQGTQAPTVVSANRPSTRTQASRTAERPAAERSPSSGTSAGTSRQNAQTATSPTAVPPLRDPNLGNRRQIQETINNSTSVISAVTGVAEEQMSRIASAISPVSTARAGVAGIDRDSRSYESSSTRSRSRGRADSGRNPKGSKSPVTGAFRELVDGAPVLDFGNGQRRSFSIPADQLGLSKRGTGTGGIHRVSTADFDEGSGSSAAAVGDFNAGTRVAASGAGGAGRGVESAGGRPGGGSSGGGGGGRGGAGLSSAGGSGGGRGPGSGNGAATAATQSASELMNRMRLAKTREAVNKLIREPEFRSNLWFNRIEVRDGGTSIGYVEADTPAGMDWPGTAPREVWVLDELMPKKRGAGR